MAGGPYGILPAERELRDTRHLPSKHLRLYLPGSGSPPARGTTRWSQAAVQEDAMAVRIRLKKVGRRHRQSYRLAAVDGRRPRDSKVIEELGSYNPLRDREELQVSINRERIEYWLSVGAQPSETVRSLLKKQGILTASS